MTQQHLPATEPTLWRAVLDRDAGLDGAFVYAVETTGIYCRPTCASRRPRREKRERPGPTDKIHANLTPLLTRRGYQRLS